MRARDEAEQRPASSRADLISIEYRGFYGRILVIALLQYMYIVPVKEYM